MEPIKRAEGTTESERYLVALGEQSFLDLWSYPNTFSSPGKELCDLLVVCGDDVIIFSDKTITWPAGTDLGVSWRRWSKAALWKSASQVHGAERWLANNPGDIFLDAACTTRLPIELPPLDRRRVHGIVVALGAEKAGGSLQICPAIKGPEHLEPANAGHPFFAVGDLDPRKSFTHVFDRTGLDVVLRELDTVTDFTMYLAARSDLIRQERLIHAPSEQDLVALYIRSMDHRGLHAFTRSDGSPLRREDKILVPGGLYSSLVDLPEYRRKQEADRASYLWDGLIRQFTQHILAGTSVEILGELPTAARAEPALRIMAQEERVHRRLLGTAVREAMTQAERTKARRFVRAMLPGRDADGSQLGYLLLILSYPDEIDLPGGYDQYRGARASMLEAYCLVTLSENRHLTRLVGIAVDSAPSVTGREGGSEDLVALEIDQWTHELETQAQQMRDHFDIWPANRRRPFKHILADEFPQDDGDGIEQIPMSRQYQRALERARAKAQRRRN